MLSSRPLRWYDFITLNIYFTGLTTLSQTLTPLIVPLLVQQFVGEARQGSYYGTLRLWTLMVALLVQALMGMLSDRNTSRFGRRRPFIFVGTLADVVVLAAIGFTIGLEGESGYWVLFFLVILHMIATNTAHGAVQGLIPDLTPEEQRGRYSGIKALLEVPVPVILVSLTIGRIVASGNLWGGLLVAIGVLLVTMIITMFAPEKPLKGEVPPLNLEPLLRLLFMTLVFTVIILGMGQAVRWSGQLMHGTNSLTNLIFMGAIGLLAILVAVALGVYFSVDIGAGRSGPSNAAFRWWVINRLAFLVGSTNIASFALYFLQGRLNIPGAQAAEPTRLLLLVVGVFILITAPPSGWLGDRYGHRRMVALSGILATLGTFILISLPNLTVIYVGAMLLGAATGLFYSSNWALGTQIVPPEQAGKYLGISNLAGAGAGAVGAYIGGPIADFFTQTMPQMPGIGYLLLFIVYGLLFVFSLIALTQVKTSQNPVA